MSAARSVPRHPAARDARRVAWLLVVVALALVAPARGGTVDRDASDVTGRSGRAHATSSHTWAGSDLRTAKAESRDRKTLPGGAATTAGIWVLLLGAVLVVRRVHTVRIGKPRVAFRRRGPPLRVAH
jgi:hypothetical protein